MRIYFIHVYRRHWEFYPDEQQSSTFEEGVDAQRSFLHWIWEKASDAWQSVENAKSGLAGRVRRMLDVLNSRVDPTEPMLRRIRTVPAVEVTYPSGISQSYVRRRLRLLLQHKTSTHRRWMYINGAILPLSMALTVIPGPNVFLAWNAYRLFAHISAFRGGQRILNGQIPVTFAPSDELDSLLSPEDRFIKPLDHAAAEDIGKRFGLPGLVDYLRKTGSLMADEHA